MTIQKKLLVLVDGSERSIQTVNYIKDFMPVDENMRIVLFHVFDGRPEEFRELEQAPTCINAVSQLQNQEAEQKAAIWWYLERAKEVLTKGGIPKQSIEIKLHLRKDGVARDIIKEAKNDYSAVIMRRRGLGALRRIILGSVAVKLLQSIAFIPIIIVGQVPTNKKILLAVDASPSSRKAVEFIGSLLGGHGYEACIFHAIIGLGSMAFKFPEVNAPEFPEVGMPDNCIEAFKLKTARLLQATKDTLLLSGFDSGKISEKIITGAHSRSLEILKETEEGGYSTIVVGRRGLSKVEAFFMGRVGHKVVYGGDKFTVWVV
ncbi:hypothetical protein DSCO28_63070 [Desulfosarcina ovata subsp. sediminis]|uniref:UspA domain-containing protein n=1 Tax=Desulfosarcina ovata subsp. sediminis TaxID=885957 RepID=A0A5K8A018_9BACT|nr:universal stress protein [Desulfosarcina ovata]BBO85741.1 hypothetical protein DSCO28_63070 [Desulfosarcina ovata subsp. sediminis]